MMQSRKRQAALQKLLGKSLQLNEYEQLLAANVVRADAIDVTMNDVMGLSKLIQDLQLKVCGWLAAWHTQPDCMVVVVIGGDGDGDGSGGLCGAVEGASEYGYHYGHSLSLSQS